MRQRKLANTRTETTGSDTIKRGRFKSKASSRNAGKKVWKDLLKLNVYSYTIII